MKTRELIEALQREDPSGEAEVIAGNTPIYFAEGQPAYYDGPLQMLIHDEEKKGKQWSIIGYKVTQRGQKVRLHLMNLEDVICDMPDAPLDLTEVSEMHRKEWEEHAAKLREETRRIDAEIAAEKAQPPA